jgi:hypothetical protein
MAACMAYTNENRKDIKMGNCDALGEQRERDSKQGRRDSDYNSYVELLDQLSDYRGCKSHGKGGNCKVHRKVAAGESQLLNNRLEEYTEGIERDTDTDKIENESCSNNIPAVKPYIQ